ncbi:unnamed protein product [Toxocara canis]|uniref:Uncharacterized protein n=1 Tax=Toxocara canis TaxID=6265 RepID=A0A3P7GH09_TOXCA|nr:unnamed protein product [Toxocara canis]
MLRAAIETDETPTPVLISSLVAIANCCISRGHTETADFYFADEEKTPKDEKLLTVFERFFFSEDDDLCMASLESACRILFYCGGCFPSVLSCCLLRCFSPKCPSRTHDFLTFFLGMYHAKSRDVNKLLPVHFFMMYFLIDWVICYPEDALTAAVVDVLPLTAPEEFQMDTSALAALTRMTDEALSVLLVYECDTLAPKMRRLWARLNELEPHLDCSVASDQSKRSTARKHCVVDESEIAKKKKKTLNDTLKEMNNTGSQTPIRSATAQVREGESVLVVLSGEQRLQSKWVSEGGRSIENRAASSYGIEDGESAHTALPDMVTVFVLRL